MKSNWASRTPWVQAPLYSTPTPRTKQPDVRKRDVYDEEVMLQRNIEEFSRLQDYMQSCDKETEAYTKMKKRYKELKVILTASGINLTEIDYIKE